MTTSQKTYDVIFVGNYTKDTIITPDGISYVDGGGMNYAASVGFRLGIHAAVVTRLSKEDKHVVENIQKMGIDCYPVYSESSTLMTLEYKTHEVDKRNLYVKGVAGSIKPEHLDGLIAHAIVVSPSLRGEVPPEFFETLHSQRPGVLFAADMQGFARVLHQESLRFEPWPEMERVLPYLDIVKTDAVEAYHLTGETDIEKAAIALSSLGAREIILTHSDGLLVYAEENFNHYPWHSISMAGRSGRGDTCLGSYVSKRLTLTASDAGKWSAAATSLKMETVGVFDRSIEEVKDLISKYYAF